MVKKLRVHFMGVGGSGMAPVAIIAKRMGYEVSGCDISESSYYSDALTNNGINIQAGHSVDHLENVDILAITPAILDINPNHPEIVEAKRRNMLMTWQQFAGEYLHKDKSVIAITGTHGKSTTTILTGVVLEEGGLDPIVEAGTVYRPWGGGYRAADSDYFVCEADEFNCNFLNFSPSIAIINNIEMDHPEFFNSFEEVKEAFKSFIKRLKDSKVLIVNEENEGVREVLLDLKLWFRENGVKVIGYYLNDRFDFPFDLEYKGELISTGAVGSVFKVGRDGWSEELELSVPGVFNISNSLGTLAAALELGISIDSVKAAFKKFKGIGRRFELIGDINNIKIYDDYAHHPTEIAAAMNTCRAGYPGQKLWAVMEPHQISRTRLFINEYADALNKADQVIITKPYVGREMHKNLEPLDIDGFVKRVNIDKTRYIENFDDVSSFVVTNAQEGDNIVVFGAGNSYKLARKILSDLEIRKNNKSL